MFGRQRYRGGTRSQQPVDFALDIMRKLGAGLCEVHAVGRAQLADLAFEIRTALQKVAGFIGKAVPDIDIGDAGLGGSIAIERIQEQRGLILLKKSKMLPRQNSRKACWRQISSEDAM